MTHNLRYSGPPTLNLPQQVLPLVAKGAFRTVKVQPLNLRRCRCLVKVLPTRTSLGAVHSARAPHISRFSLTDDKRTESGFRRILGPVSAMTSGGY